MCQSRARAPAGPLTAPPRGKGSKLSKCRVYSWKGCVPPPCHAMPHTAEDLHAHCTAIHLRSLRLPRGSQVDLLIPEHCASTRHAMAVSPFPQVTFLSVSPPISQELLWRRVEMAGALRGRGTLHPSSARYVCWCRHHCRLLRNKCHPLPHSPASPDVITVLWTVLTQEGRLDIWPLPLGRAFSLSPLSQDTGLSL